ncbi:MAG TPA: PDZ domain-containing protein [Acidobacteriaceae bacterium]
MKSLAVMVVAGCLAAAPLLLAQQQIFTVLADDPAYLAHGTPGYLGVATSDIDSERATQLKLKDTRGAEVVNVDHDAPACKAGIRLHDVILQMNNQLVEGEAQLRRMLRDTPVGRTVSLLISRDGQQQNFTVQLVDRSTLEADAWSQHIPVEPDDDPIALPSASSSFGSGFLSVLGMNSAYTGLELDMLGPQLADYFGVHSGQGLLVKRVDDNSPGSAAGLRAGDVITRVNGRIMATTSQWLHTMHSNRGKQVELTVVRDRKEATVTIVAGRPKTKG